MMQNSIDPDFEARKAAYEANRRRGMAFAAEGTVGGKAVRARGPAWRPKLFRRFLRIFVILAIMKVCLYHAAQTAGYNPSNSVILDSSNVLHRVAEYVLYPDPVSVWASQYLRIAQQFVAIELRNLL